MREEGIAFFLTILFRRESTSTDSHALPYFSMYVIRVNC